MDQQDTLGIDIGTGAFSPPEAPPTWAMPEPAPITEGFEPDVLAFDDAAYKTNLGYSKGQTDEWASPRFDYPQKEPTDDSFKKITRTVDDPLEDRVTAVRSFYDEAAAGIWNDATDRKQRLGALGKLEADYTAAKSDLFNQFYPTKIKELFPDMGERKAFLDELQVANFVGLQNSTNPKHQQAYKEITDGFTNLFPASPLIRGGTIGNKDGSPVAEYQIKGTTNGNALIALQFQGEDEQGNAGLFTKENVMEMPWPKDEDVTAEVAKIRDQAALRRKEADAYRLSQRTMGRDPGGASLGVQNAASEQVIASTLQDADNLDAEAKMLEAGGPTALIERRVEEKIRTDEKLLSQVRSPGFTQEAGKALDKFIINAAATVDSIPGWGDLAGSMSSALGFGDPGNVVAQAPELLKTIDETRPGMAQTRMEGGVGNDVMLGAIENWPQIAAQVGMVAAGGMPAAIAGRNPGMLAMRAASLAPIGAVVPGQALITVEGKALQLEAMGDFEGAKKMRESGPAFAAANLATEIISEMVFPNSQARIGMSFARGAKEGFKDVVKEAIEEPIAGFLQDSVANPIIGEYNNPMDLARRGQEALTGFAMFGVQMPLQRGINRIMFGDEQKQQVAQVNAAAANVIASVTQMQQGTIPTTVDTQNEIITDATGNMVKNRNYVSQDSGGKFGIADPEWNQRAAAAGMPTQFDTQAEAEAMAQTRYQNLFKSSIEQTVGGDSVERQASILTAAHVILEAARLGGGGYTSEDLFEAIMVMETPKATPTQATPVPVVGNPPAPLQITYPWSTPAATPAAQSPVVQSTPPATQSIPIGNPWVSGINPTQAPAPTPQQALPAQTVNPWTTAAPALPTQQQVINTPPPTLPAQTVNPWTTAAPADSFVPSSIPAIGNQAPVIETPAAPPEMVVPQQDIESAAPTNTIPSVETSNTATAASAQQQQGANEKVQAGIATEKAEAGQAATNEKVGVPEVVIEEPLDASSPHSGAARILAENVRVALRNPVIRRLYALSGARVIVGTSESFSKMLGFAVGKYPASAVSMPDGQIYVLFHADVHSGVRVDWSVAHEGIHAADYKFRMTDKGSVLFNDALKAFDPKSKDFDKKLSGYMAKEYGMWKKLSPSGKLAETVRAVLAGRMLGYTTSRQSKFTEYLQAFLKYIGKLFVDGPPVGPLAAYVQNLEAFINEQFAPETPKQIEDGIKDVIVTATQKGDAAAIKKALQTGLRQAINEMEAVEPEDIKALRTMLADAIKNKEGKSKIDSIRAMIANETRTNEKITITVPNGPSYKLIKTIDNLRDILSRVDRMPTKFSPANNTPVDNTTMGKSEAYYQARQMVDFMGKDEAIKELERQLSQATSPAGKKLIQDTIDQANKPDILAEDAGDELTQLEGGDMARAMEAMGASLYARNIGGTIGKELFQNSVDAVMQNPSSKPKIIFSGTRDGSIIVADTGTGMTPTVIVDKFIRAFVSGKGVGAGGGFGLAKLAFLGSPESFKVVSISRETDGRLVKTTLEGTGKSFLQFNQKPPAVTFRPDTDIVLAEGFTMRFTYDIPARTETGTASKMKINDPYDASSAISSGMTYVDGVFDAGLTDSWYGNDDILKGEDALRDLGYASRQSMDELKKYAKGKKPYGVIHSVSLPSADIEIIAREGSKISKTTYPYVAILNRGIFQFSTNIRISEEVALPEGIAVNIKPKVRAGTSDYPFTANRESITNDVSEEVSRFFKDAGAREMRKLNDKYANALSSAVKVEETDKVILDAGSSVPAEYIQELAKDESVKKVLADVGRIQDAILKMLSKRFGREGYGRASFAGLLIGARAYGVHFGKPHSSEPTSIYHDIWKEMQFAIEEFSRELADNPDLGNIEPSESMGVLYDAFLAKIAGVAFHEALHQIINSEGESLARELTFKAGDIVNAVVSLLENNYSNEEVSKIINDIDAQANRLKKTENEDEAGEFVTSQGGYNGYAMAERRGPDESGAGVEQAGDGVVLGEDAGDIPSFSSLTDKYAALDPDESTGFDNLTKDQRIEYIASWIKDTVKRWGHFPKLKDALSRMPLDNAKVHAIFRNPNDLASVAKLSGFKLEYSKGEQQTSGRPERSKNFGRTGGSGAYSKWISPELIVRAESPDIRYEDQGDEEYEMPGWVEAIRKQSNNPAIADVGAIMRFSKASNFSTVIHELGHVLSILQVNIQPGNPAAGTRSVLEEMTGPRFIDLYNFATRDGRIDPSTPEGFRAYLERISEGFERFLVDGDIPVSGNKGLVEAFKTMRDGMKKILQSYQAQGMPYGINLPDDEKLTDDILDAYQEILFHVGQSEARSTWDAATLNDVQIASKMHLEAIARLGEDQNPALYQRGPAVAYKALAPMVDMAILTVRQKGGGKQPSSFDQFKAMIDSASPLLSLNEGQLQLVYQAAAVAMPNAIELNIKNRIEAAMAIPLSSLANDITSAQSLINQAIASETDPATKAKLNTILDQVKTSRTHIQLNNARGRAARAIGASAAAKSRVATSTLRTMMAGYRAGQKDTSIKAIADEVRIAFGVYAKAQGVRRSTRAMVSQILNGAKLAQDGKISPMDYLALVQAATTTVEQDFAAAAVISFNRGIAAGSKATIGDVKRRAALLKQIVQAELKTINAATKPLLKTVLNALDGVTSTRKLVKAAYLIVKSFQNRRTREAYSKAKKLAKATKKNLNAGMFGAAGSDVAALANVRTSDIPQSLLANYLGLVSFLGQNSRDIVIDEPILRDIKAWNAAIQQHFAVNPPVSRGVSAASASARAAEEAIKKAQALIDYDVAKKSIDRNAFVAAYVKLYGKTKEQALTALDLMETFLPTLESAESIDLDHMNSASIKGLISSFRAFNEGIIQSQLIQAAHELGIRETRDTLAPVLQQAIRHILATDASINLQGLTPDELERRTSNIAATINLFAHTGRYNKKRLSEQLAAAGLTHMDSLLGTVSAMSELIVSPLTQLNFEANVRKQRLLEAGNLYTDAKAHESESAITTTMLAAMKKAGLLDVAIWQGNTGFTAPLSAAVGSVTRAVVPPAARAYRREAISRILGIAAIQRQREANGWSDPSAPSDEHNYVLWLLAGGPGNVSSEFGRREAVRQQRAAAALMEALNGAPPTWANIERLLSADNRTAIDNADTVFAQTGETVHYLNMMDENKPLETFEKYYPIRDMSGKTEDLGRAAQLASMSMMPQPSSMNVQAGSRNRRTDTQLKLVDADFFGVTKSHVSQVTGDAAMSPFLNRMNEAMNRIRRSGEMGGTGSSVIEDIQDQLLEHGHRMAQNIFFDSDVATSVFGVLAGMLKQKALATVERPLIEGLGGFVAAVISNPVKTIDGAIRYMSGTKGFADKLMFDLKSDIAMRQGATALEMEFANINAAFSGLLNSDFRLPGPIDTIRRGGAMADKLPTAKGLFGYIQTAYYPRLIKALTHVLTSAGETMVARPFWYGTFTQSLEEQSGIPWSEDNYTNGAYTQEEIKRAQALAETLVSRKFAESTPGTNPTRNLEPLNQQDTALAAFYRFFQYSFTYWAGAQTRNMRASMKAMVEGNAGGYDRRDALGVMGSIVAAGAVNSILVSTVYNLFAALRESGNPEEDERRKQRLKEFTGNLTGQNGTDEMVAFYSKMGMRGVFASAMGDRPFLMRMAWAGVLEGANYGLGRGATWQGAYDPYKDNITFEMPPSVNNSILGGISYLTGNDMRIRGDQDTNVTNIMSAHQFFGLASMGIEETFSAFNSASNAYDDIVKGDAVDSSASMENLAYFGLMSVNLLPIAGTAFKAVRPKESVNNPSYATRNQGRDERTAEKEARIALDEGDVVARREKMAKLGPSVVEHFDKNLAKWGQAKAEMTQFDDDEKNKVMSKALNEMIGIDSDKLNQTITRSYRQMTEAGMGKEFLRSMVRLSAAGFSSMPARTKGSQDAESLRDFEQSRYNDGVSVYRDYYRQAEIMRESLKSR